MNLKREAKILAATLIITIALVVAIALITNGAVAAYHGCGL